MFMLQERYAALTQGFKQVLPDKSFRINTLKAPKDLIKRLEDKGVVVKKIDFLKNGYTYHSKFSLGSTLEYLMGYIYLQEAASQVPVEVLSPSEEDVVLDMAASPGSKTTQLASMMNNKGLVYAVEKDKRRISSLVNNLERCGVSNTMVFNMNALDVKKLGVEFDKILLDAPCSGNFCVEEDFFNKRKVSDFSNRSALQKRLLEEACDVLKKDGVLVYSTCSLEPEEDEEVVSWALKNLPLDIIPLEVGDRGVAEFYGKEYDKRVIGCSRFWPHRHKTQGFFVARFKKL